MSNTESIGTTEKTLARYVACAAAIGNLPTLSMCTLEMPSETPKLIGFRTGHSAILKELRTCSTGWSCHQDNLVTWKNGSAQHTCGSPYTLSDNDSLLYGEWVNGESTSIHVRQTRDGWCVVTLQEISGSEHLAKDVTLIGTQGVGDLHYRVYLEHTEEYGWRPFASRFLRFAEGN